MARTIDTLYEVLEPVVTGLGYELVGVDYRPSPTNAMLRLYIDGPEGVTIDDCTRVSRQVSGVMDVEDPIPSAYYLEVSSPGLDRPIFKEADYQRFAGERVHLRLQGLFNGRRKYSGVLRGLRDDCVIVEENGTEIEVPLARIDKANLERAV